MTIYKYVVGMMKFYSKKKKNQTETRPYHTKNDILPDEKSHKQQNKPIINPHDDDYFIVEKTFWRFSSITHIPNKNHYLQNIGKMSMMMKKHLLNYQMMKIMTIKLKTKKLLQAKKRTKQSLCSLPTISNSRGS